MSAGHPEPGSDPNFERLAQDITDQIGIDWDAEEQRDPRASARLRGLRLIADVAHAHRELGVSVDGEGLGPGAADQAAPAGLFHWGSIVALERVGAGGFGEVYRGWDSKLQREVALKLVRSGASSSVLRWLEEARRLARVRHPNVLTVHGADVHDERPGMWTDFIHGGTVEQLILELGPMGAREAALLGIDLCLALTAVHAAGLIHGDVKASNVMREDGGRLVLMDFGSVHDSKGGGQFTGTPLSTAPEVLRGESVHPTADIYSLGVLLFRSVTGRHPVEATSLQEMRQRLAAHAGTSLRELRPELPPAFVRVVERALALAPNERYQSAAELERALAATLDSSPAVARGSAALRSRPSRRVGVAVAVALLVVALIAGRQLWIHRELGRPGGPGSDALSVSATLVRVTQHAAEPLASGATIALGDHLALEFQAAAPMHVYVLNEDDQGNVYVLFPVAGVDVRNPLEGGRPHRLPGSIAGEPFDWIVTTAGGQEHLLMIAAHEALPALQAQIETIQPSSPQRGVEYAQLTRDAIDELRGIGGMEASREAPPAGASALAGIAAALGRATSAGHEVWTRQLILAGPSR